MCVCVCTRVSSLFVGRASLSNYIHVHVCIPYKAILLNCAGAQLHLK